MGYQQVLEYLVIETYFPRSDGQCYLMERLRNLAAKAPTNLWPDSKNRVEALYDVESRPIVRNLAESLIKVYAAKLFNIVGCFMDEITRLYLHTAHPIATRKTIFNVFNEKAFSKSCLWPSCASPNAGVWPEPPPSKDATGQGWGAPLAKSTKPKQASIKGPQGSLMPLKYRLTLRRHPWTPARVLWLNSRQKCYQLSDNTISRNRPL